MDDSVNKPPETDAAPPPTAPSGTSKWLRAQASKAFDLLSWLVLLGLAVHLLTRETGGPKLNTQAPQHALLNLATNNSQSLPGTSPHGPILIKAFASWCGACKRSTWIDDQADVGATNKLSVVAVSVDDHIENAQTATEQWPISGTVLFDQDGAFSRDYNIQLLPTYILIDENNRVVRVTSGLPGPLDLLAWKRATHK